MKVLEKVLAKNDNLMHKEQTVCVKESVHLSTHTILKKCVYKVLQTK